MNNNLFLPVLILLSGVAKGQNYQAALPCSLSLNISSINVSCNGFNDGFISISPVNGAAPYNYLWSTGDTVSFLNNLIPNEYFVTVTDSAGCMVIDSIAVTEPFPLNAFFDSIENVSCNYPNTTELCFLPYYCDGHATGTVSGGTPPYLYSWQDLLCGTWWCNYQWAANNLWGCASIYKFTVTDSNGCMLMDTITITGPPKLFKTVNAVSAICSACVGSASVQLSGGSPPYNFFWDNNPSISSISSDDSTSSITALPGTYSIEIISWGECTLCTSVTIGWAEECWKLSANIIVPDNMFSMTDSGAIVQFTFNGANAANYFWAFGDGDTSTVQNPVHTYINPGIYTIMLVGSNSYCSDTAYVTITILDVGLEKSGCYSGSCGEKFKIQPNPSDGNFWLEMNFNSKAEKKITVYDVFGREVKQIITKQKKHQIDLSGYPAGIYLIEIRDEKFHYNSRIVKY